LLMATNLGSTNILNLELTKFLFASSIFIGYRQLSTEHPHKLLD